MDFTPVFWVLADGGMMGADVPTTVPHSLIPSNFPTLFYTTALLSAPKFPLDIKQNK